MTQLKPTNLYAVPVPPTDRFEHSFEGGILDLWADGLPFFSSRKFRYLGLVTKDSVGPEVVQWFTNMFPVSEADAIQMLHNTMTANECFLENPYEKASDLFTAEEANGFPLEYFRQQELRKDGLKKTSPVWAIIERLTEETK